MPPAWAPAFSFSTWVNSCRLVTICGAFDSTVRGQFLGIIRSALRHFRKRHHDRERVVNRVLDLAEFLLQLREFLLRNGGSGLGHGRFKSVANMVGCA